MIANFMVERQRLNPWAALRGGNWNNGDNAGVFNANSNNPDNSNTNNGFRCPETDTNLFFGGETFLYLPGSEAKPPEFQNYRRSLSRPEMGENKDQILIKNKVFRRVCLCDSQ